jgi:hypothetical protein
MNFYNTNIHSNHDAIMYLNEQWAQHLNFLLTLHFWDDYENKLVEDELQGTLCYDV